MKRETGLSLAFLGLSAIEGIMVGVNLHELQQDKETRQRLEQSITDHNNRLVSQQTQIAIVKNEADNILKMPSIQHDIYVSCVEQNANVFRGQANNMEGCK